jgi:bifunctional ADP-heptose synthase (sugar kinase/adenylyltransferase)
LASEYLPSLAAHASDTIGAGDVMLSALALCEVVGAPPSHGLYLGSCLSALHVAAMGNEPRTLPELERSLASRRELGPGWHEVTDFDTPGKLRRSA